MSFKDRPVASEHEQCLLAAANGLGGVRCFDHGDPLIFALPSSTPAALQFPSLDVFEADLRTWPLPPSLEWRAGLPPNVGAQPCRIETRTASVVQGELVTIDFTAGTLLFRTSAEGPSVRLTFSRIRSLTLSEPLRLAADRSERVSAWRPDDAAERAFTIDWADAEHGRLSGVTAGHATTDEGLFLFPPRDGFASVERMFVPRSAYCAWHVAALEQPAPASKGIASLDALLQAIDAQERAPVLRIGRSLVDLGLLTQAQLDGALAAQSPDVPLGEMLVSAGTISRPDLLTALAHKMGYAFVDLSRFPIDHKAAKLLSYSLAMELCALPIAIDSSRLVVVTDRPVSSARLRGIPALAPYKLLIVVAPAGQITEAIARLPHADLWAANVPLA